MATPVRMVELECPNCHGIHWVMDNDFRGSSLMGRPEISYPGRTYQCPACQTASVGYRVLRGSPPGFFLQPHGLYPMTTTDFARWLAIFRTHFPSNDRLKSVGIFWYPGDRDEEQERRLDAARWIAGPRCYQISLANRSHEDDCIQVRVEARGRQGFGDAYFFCRPEIELKRCYAQFDADELEQMRSRLASITPEIHRAWDQFAKEAREAQARWLPKLLESKGT